MICDKALADLVPQHLPVMLSSNPHAAFAMAGGLFYPAALRPVAFSGESEIAPSAVIDPSARLEKGVIVEPMAVIGAHAEIGEGTRIGAHSIMARMSRLAGIVRLRPARALSALCSAMASSSTTAHASARMVSVMRRARAA